MREGRIVEHQGRFIIVLSENERSREVRAGMDIEVYLGGHWITGSIEESAATFVASIGGAYAGCCGICDGMRVRL